MIDLTKPKRWWTEKKHAPRRASQVAWLYCLLWTLNAVISRWREETEWQLRFCLTISSLIRSVPSFCLADNHILSRHWAYYCVSISPEEGWNVLVPPSLVFVGVGLRPLFDLLLLGAGRGATVLAGGTVFPRSPLLCCCFQFEMLVAPSNCVLAPWGLILSQHGVSHVEVPPLLYNIFILMLSSQRTVPQSINGHARGKKRVNMTVIATWPCCITTVFQMSWLSCACLTVSCRCTVATCAVARQNLKLFVLECFWHFNFCCIREFNPNFSREITFCLKQEWLEQRQKQLALSTISCVHCFHSFASPLILWPKVLLVTFFIFYTSALWMSVSIFHPCLCCVSMHQKIACMSFSMFIFSVYLRLHLLFAFIVFIL